MARLEARVKRVERLRQRIQAPVKLATDVIAPAQPTGDQQYAMEVSINALLAPSVEKPEKSLSQRQRLIEIQATFGYERDLKSLALMVIDPDPEKENDRKIKRFLSRRGIRQTEYVEIQERFDDFYAISILLKQMYPGSQAFAQRREALFNANGQIFTETGADAFKTNTHLLVDAMERTADFLR